MEAGERQPWSLVPATPATPATRNLDCQRTVDTSKTINMIISDSDVQLVRDVVGPTTSDALIRGMSPFSRHAKLPKTVF